MIRVALFAILGLAAQSGRALGAVPSPEEAFARGLEHLAAGRYLEAAEAYQEELRLHLSSFTVRVAVYCDAGNLDRQLRSAGHPKEILLLRRPVRDQYCWGLYWGLFATRSDAQAAVGRVPASLRAPGQAAVPISTGVLAPTAPPSPRSATRSAPALAQPPNNERRVADSAISAPVHEPIPIESAPSRTTPLLPSLPETNDAATEPQSPLTSALQDPARATSPMPSRRYPRAEIAVSYSYLWVDNLVTFLQIGGGVSVETDLDSGPFKKGWLLSANVNVTDKIGVTAELSGHHRTDTVVVEGQRLEFSPSLLGLHGGVRYTDRDDNVATPYAQMLWGFTRLSVLGGSETNVSAQAGVGVMFRLTECFKVGVGGDYRRVFRDGRDRNEVRVHAGVVFCVCEK